MAVSTIKDVQDRLVTNQNIVDPVARQADYNSLLADIRVAFGDGSEDAAVQEAMRRCHLRV